MRTAIALNPEGEVNGVKVRAIPGLKYTLWRAEVLYCCSQRQRWQAVSAPAGESAGGTVLTPVDGGPGVLPGRGVGAPLESQNSFTGAAYSPLRSSVA